MFMESDQSAIQLFSKKFFERKVFLAAPIHHHFEAKGWPETKVTMRAWIFTAVTAIIGVIIGILGAGKYHYDSIRNLRQEVSGYSYKNMEIKKIQDAEVEGKKVLLRVDFNAAMEERYSQGKI